MSTAIKVEHISKQYQLGKIGGGTLYESFQQLFSKKTKQETFWSLDDISFEVNTGDVLGIIGHNGAGKSTLLKVISKITKPTKGKITLYGRVSSLLEVGTGFHPELSGRENIYLNGAILGMSKNEIKSKFDEIVAFSGVESFLETPVKRYSSGMYVRLAFSVAAHLEPEIFIIDEVLAVGDYEFQKKCLGKMESVAKEGRTVLFVSHNMGAVESLCNRCLYIDHGKVVEDSKDTRFVINNYLSDSITHPHNGALEIISFDSSTQNDIYQLKYFGILNETGSVHQGFLSRNQLVKVRIQMDLKTSNPNLNFGFAVYDNTERCVFWSFVKDDKEDTWPSFNNSINTIVEIPGGLFNDGNYRIEFISALHNQKWISEPLKGAPRIEFEVKGGAEGSEWFNAASRPGLIAPVLTWKNA